MSFIKAVRLEPDPADRPVPAQVNGHRWEATAYAQAALNAELTNIAYATDGTRNDTLNRAAFNMAQLIAGGQISADQVQDALVSAARAIGLGEREIAGTIRSGFAKGQMRARTPTPATPTVTPLTAPGVAGPQAGDNPVDWPAPVDWKAVWDNPTELEWILEPLIPAGRYLALYSPPKVGKSLLMLELAVAIANGRDALGVPTARTRVLYIDRENDVQTDIKARLEAMGHHYGDLNDLIYYSYLSDLPDLDTPPGGQYLLGLAQHHNAGLVIIDTISRFVGGEENDNNTWIALYKHTAMAMKENGIALMRLDHSGKDLDKGQRGGSAKLGDIDLVWRMTEIVRDASYLLQLEAQRIQVHESTLNLTRDHAPLAHRVDTRQIAEVKEEAILKALDEAGLEADAGRVRCEQVLRTAGIRVRTTTLAAIIKRRKLGLTPFTPTTPDLFPTPVPGPPL